VRRRANLNTLIIIPVLLIIHFYFHQQISFGHQIINFQSYKTIQIATCIYDQWKSQPWPSYSRRAKGRGRCRANQNKVLKLLIIHFYFHQQISFGHQIINFQSYKTIQIAACIYDQWKSQPSPLYIVDE
jgi:putative effector of murein hydrolase